MLLKIEEDRQTAELAKISGEWEAFEDEADGLKLTIQMERTVQFVGKTKSFPELQLDVMRKKIEVSRRVWADEVQSALTNNREPVMKPAMDLVVSLRTLLLDKHHIARGIADSLTHDKEVKADMLKVLEKHKDESGRAKLGRFGLAQFQLEHMGHLLFRPPSKVKDPSKVEEPEDWDADSGDEEDEPAAAA